MVTAVSLLFVDLQVDHWGIIIATVFLTSVVFSLGGLINAVFAKTFDDISIVPTFVLTPLTYLGGVFYSISLLPEFWQSVSRSIRLSTWSMRSATVSLACRMWIS